MDRGGLLRDHRRVLPVGQEQHGGHEPDPLCRRGRRAERDERLPARVDQPVERGERGEAGGVGAP
jgi:hypothetical protein